MYVDNAAMQLVRAPKKFDVIVTGNMFGDILSDAAAMLTGSIGMLPSASLDANSKRLYEPSRIGTRYRWKGIANPLATILSAAMMLRYSLKNRASRSYRKCGERRVSQWLAHSRYFRSGIKVGTSEMGDAVVKALA